MKTNRFFFVTAITLSAIIACSKEIAPETDAPEAPGTTEALASGRNFQTLVAAPAEGALDVDSKTAFVGGTFMWKQNNNIVVRSNNANGFTTFTYSGADTAGEAEFAIRAADSEDKIVTGNNSFAYYPAKTSGTGATAFPREDEGSLKLVLKDGYTWFDGNVEAPMLAKVTDDGTALQFKHLGGVLKVTYKYLPPKAAKLVISAPASEAGQYYKICDVQKSLVNWETAAGGFTGETPYLQAYAVSGKKEITQNIVAATAAQRASDDGVTVYIPLPVGPGDAHTYPEIDIRLTFEDGTTVPGSERIAKNVKIERATIKQMRPIALTKYTVELVAGNTSYTAGATNGTGTAAKFYQVRGLCWKDNSTLAITESNNNGHIRLFNKSTKAVTTANSTNLGGAPWQAAMKDGVLYMANKGGNKIQSFNFSTSTASDVKTGMNNPMSVCFVGSDAYVCEQAGQALYKFEGGFTGTKTKLYDFSTLDSYVDRAVCMKPDANGNLIVGLSISDANSKYFKIVVIAPDGSKLQEIGEGTKGTSFANLVDGGIAKAVFSAGINGMALDSQGNIYVVDSWAVRKITHTAADYSDAVVTTVLGNGDSFVTTTPSRLVKFGTVSDIAVDPENDNILYVMDFGKYVLAKVTIE